MAQNTQEQGTLDRTQMELEAIRLVRQERDEWETEFVFVTERVAFHMRRLIRQLRKNYWGVFDNPKDPITARKKIWIPLTESLVDSVVKNIDLDTKDVNFRAKNIGGIGLTEIVRSSMKNLLDKIGFGEKLDMFERNLAINGTAVWKIIKQGKEVFLQDVDLLNIYIDPTSPTIQDAYRFTERSLMTQQDVQRMTGWINTKDVVPVTGLPRQDTIQSTAPTGTSKFIDVWEMWGKIPKSLITGKKEDEDQEIDGHIVVSGLDQNGKQLLHLVEKNTNKDSQGQVVKPYEEAWYTRSEGRWYGKGVAEKVMMLQLWMNTIVNIRINRSYVSQLGLFKIRRNAGITPQMLSKLAANGGILVNSMDDVEQLVMKEASEASYKDEDNIMNWARQTTAAFEIVTGEQLPSSTTATAAAIQGRSAQSQFILIREQIGMFIQRVLDRQIIPKVQNDMLKSGNVLRVTGDSDAIRKLDEWKVSRFISERISELNGQGLFVDPNDVEIEKQSLLERLATQGDSRMVDIAERINITDFDVKVFVTNEEVDKGILAQNLISALQLAPEFRDVILRQIFDIMGLPSGTIQQRPNLATLGEQQQVAQGASAGPQNAVDQLAQSNTAQSRGARA